MKVFAVEIKDEFGVKFDTFGDLFSTILFNVYIIAGVIFLFLLIFGGVSLIIGAGSQNSEKVAGGQKAISSALAGFIVIFASYFIIQIIELITGVNILKSTL